MGRRCRYAHHCHIYLGKVELKQPLFLVKNIYCNNGPRWWQKCNVFAKFNQGEVINPTLVPADDLRLE